MSHTSPDGVRTFLAWIWGGMLIVGGALFLLFTVGGFTPPAPLMLFVAGGVAVVGLPFLARWLARRQEWWALLAAWCFFSVAILLVAIHFFSRIEQLVVITVLVEIGLPFLAIYLSDRQRRWALIPAYCMLALSGLVALTLLVTSQEMLGAFALLAAALPFWLIYIGGRQHWWALIPAGVFSIVGVILLLVFSVLRHADANIFIILNAALAVIFLTAWLAVRRFDWALWVASGFAGAAILSVWYPASTNWALVALALGLYILFRQVWRPQKAALPAPPAQPTSQPAQTVSSPTQMTPPQQTPPTSPVPQPGVAPVKKEEAPPSAEPKPPTELPQPDRPVIEFRPLDPFKERKDREKKQEE